MVYAQINEDKICVAISQAGGTISGEDIIELEMFDASILGKKYNNGIWEDVYVEPVEAEPTQLDRIEEQQLITMEATATVYEAVLALGGEQI